MALLLKLTLSVIIESTRFLVLRFDFLNIFSESLSQDKMEAFSNPSDQRRPQSAGVRALRHRRSSYIHGHLPGVPDECETKYVPNAINFLQFVSLPAATKLGQGNIFIGVCQDFCSQGEGWSGPGGGVSGPGGVSNFSGGLQFFFLFFINFFPPQKNSSGMHPPPRRSKRCRYASYWNAFLF